VLGFGGAAVLGGADAQAPDDILVEVADGERCHADPHAASDCIDSILLSLVPCIGSRHDSRAHVAPMLDESASNTTTGSGKTSPSLATGELVTTVSG